MSHSADSSKGGIVDILARESFRSETSDSLVAANAGWEERMAVLERDAAATLERKARLDEVSDDDVVCGVCSDAGPANAAANGMESAMNAIAATITRKIDEVMVPCVAFVLFVIMKRGSP